MFYNSVIVQPLPTRVALSASLPGIDLPTSICKIPFVTDPAAKSKEIYITHLFLLL